jgi:tetratricopeptide (TPR) repeat protein
MKYVLPIMLLTFIFGFSQSNETELSFDTKYYNAVDKWIAFPKKVTDTSYSFGFIYLDDTAGFTFDYESKFIKTDNGLQKLPREFEAALKSRLAESTIDVAVLSDIQVSQLNLPKVPEWLAGYKVNSEEVSYLKNIGFHYNHVGASDLALEPLKKVYEIEPHFAGLEFELAYAYNALHEFSKAIPILERAIENDPTNFLFYRELGFSLKNTDQNSKAEETYKTGIKLTDDKYQKSEMAINMAQSYYLEGNRKKFDEWASITRKYTEKDSNFDKFLDDWDKKFKE